MKSDKSEYSSSDGSTNVSHYTWKNGRSVARSIGIRWPNEGMPSASRAALRNTAIPSGKSGTGVYSRGWACSRL